MPLSSPSRLLKENEDIQWLNSEVNDYSLTSLLGHLESPLKVSQPSIPGDVTISQDVSIVLIENTVKVHRAFKFHSSVS